MDWTEVATFPKYSVNSLGQVKHNKSGRLIKPHINRSGTVYVALMQDEFEHFSRSLPLLVAETFIPRPREEFDTPINLDGDRYNCSVENLMWRPRWFAIQYHRQFRYTDLTHAKAPVRDLETDEILPDSFVAATRYGLLEHDILKSIIERTYVWPTYQQFDWAP